MKDTALAIAGTRRLKDHLARWWRALLNPSNAGALILEDKKTGFNWFLAALVAALYAVYGASMGLFVDFGAGLMSAAKLPFLYIGTQLICFPAFYVMNCRIGPGLARRQCPRLLLVATSANAVAMASYAPLSFFFTLTTSDEGYAFLAAMHVAVFGIAGLISVRVIGALFASASRELGKKVKRGAAWSWGVLYALVGTEMAWCLRPWIGWPGEPYSVFKPLQESFIEAIIRLISILFTR